MEHSKPADVFSLSKFFQEVEQKVHIKPTKVVEAIEDDPTKDSSNTRTQLLMPLKKRQKLDQQVTVNRSHVNAAAKKYPPAEKMLQLSASPEENGAKKGKVKKPALIIPKDQAYEQVLAKGPLRERFGQLLSGSQKYSIGYEHQKLLLILKSIDNTLEYLTSNRAKKVFFEELRKNVFNSGKLTVTKEDLQRLLFLSKDLFEVTWEMNTSIGRYDLLIHIPKVNSEDVRRVQVREKIVEYLLVKQAEYIAAAPANTEIKLSSSWVKGFNYQNVEIPLLSLPVHPHAKNSDMREYSESQLDGVRNSKLKRILRNQKEKSSARSLSSENIADIIFSSNSQKIKAMLYNSIRELEQQQAQAAVTVSNQKEIRISKDQLKGFCEKINLVYISRRVSNVFKANLQDLLKKSMSFTDAEVETMLETVLKLEQQVGYLKKVTTSDGRVVLQATLSKFAELMAFIETMP